VFWVSWVMSKEEDKLLKDTGRNEVSMHEAAGRGPEFWNCEKNQMKKQIKNIFSLRFYLILLFSRLLYVI